MYIISEYLYQHVKVIKETSLSEIENGEIEWDIYRTDLSFKEKILALNPPLNSEEMEQEKLSERKIKKYHYFYKEDGENN